MPGLPVPQSAEVEFAPFTSARIDSFLESARREGWITDRREMEFLLEAYPAGCLVHLHDSRETGFITSIRHQCTAWIGNLLVLPQQRQKGIGRGLIEKVLQTLDLSGCETVWLTASPDGVHLYETLGFVPIDRVQRWTGTTALSLRADRPVRMDALATVDYFGWGDDRPAVYGFVRDNSVMSGTRGSFLVTTPCGNARHIGPWGAASREAAAGIFDATFGQGSDAIDTFLDVPANNVFAGEFLRSRGFSVIGSTLLMYRGKRPDYRADYVYSLASMGSYG